MGPGGVRLNILKMMLIPAAVCCAGLLFCAGFGLIQTNTPELIVNILEIIIGLAAGTLLPVALYAPGYLTLSSDGKRQNENA